MDLAVLGLVVWSILSMMPAFVAREKGYSFTIWWFLTLTTGPLAVACIVGLPDRRSGW